MRRRICLSRRVQIETCESIEEMYRMGDVGIISSWKHPLGIVRPVDIWTRADAMVRCSIYYPCHFMIRCNLLHRGGMIVVRALEAPIACGGVEWISDVIRETVTASGDVRVTGHGIH